MEQRYASVTDRERAREQVQRDKDKASGMSPAEYHQFYFPVIAAPRHCFFYTGLTRLYGLATEPIQACTFYTGLLGMGPVLVA
jgi:hypothetical protein